MTFQYDAMDFAFFHSTGTHGFAGRCEITRSAEGGDPFVKLERSLRVLQDMQRRADANPHWGAHLDA
jgi:hypothetical protein